jgi:hypothetical protein
MKKIVQLNIFPIFGHQNPGYWIRIGIQPKMLDLDPESVNPDSKHRFNAFQVVALPEYFSVT